MRKAIAICLAVLGLFCTVHAQDAHRPEPEFYDSDRPASFLEMNPHISLGLSAELENYSKVIPGASDLMHSPGCLIGLGMDVRFQLRNSFGLVTGLDLYINNSKYAISIDDVGMGTISTMYVRNHYYTINVPAYLSWRFNIGRRMMWNVDAGLYLSRGIGGNTKASGYATGVNSIGQPVVMHAVYETKYFKSNTPLINGVDNFDYGLRIGTGLVYRHKYTLGAVFQVGLRNLAQNHGTIDVKYRHMSLAFQLGYIF